MESQLTSKARKYKSSIELKFKFTKKCVFDRNFTIFGNLNYMKKFRVFPMKQKIHICRTMYLFDKDVWIWWFHMWCMVYLQQSISLTYLYFDIMVCCEERENTYTFIGGLMHILMKGRRFFDDEWWSSPKNKYIIESISKKA